MVALVVALTGVACSSVDLGRVMIVGDSISHGSSGDYTWRYLADPHLRSRRAVVDFVGPRNDLFAISTGADGDTDQTYADPDFDTDHDAFAGRTLAFAAAEIGDTVGQYHPTSLLVLLGINDLTWGQASAAQLEESLRSFIANARGANADLAFVLGRVLPITGAPAGSEQAGRIAEANTRIKAVADELSTPASPIDVAATDEQFVPEDDTWDGVHPNTRGELRIAAAFADALGFPYPRPIPDPPSRPLQAPVLLGDILTPGTATLTWTTPAGTYAYWVWDRADEADEWQRVAGPVAADQTPWSVTGLAEGSTHEYRVQPVKTDLFSNTITLTDP